MQTLSHLFLLSSYSADSTISPTCIIFFTKFFFLCIVTQLKSSISCPNHLSVLKMFYYPSPIIASCLCKYFLIFFSIEQMVLIISIFICKPYFPELTRCSFPYFGLQSLNNGCFEKTPTQFYCWSWCYMVWNITLVISDHLSSSPPNILPTLIALTGAGEWEKFWCKMMNGKHHSAVAKTSVLSIQFWLQI